VDEDVLGISDVVTLPPELTVGCVVDPEHEVEFDGYGLVVGTRVDEDVEPTLVVLYTRVEEEEL
jgi:hypothetical protein